MSRAISAKLKYRITVYNKETKANMVDAETASLTIQCQNMKALRNGKGSHFTIDFLDPRDLKQKKTKSKIKAKKKKVKR